MNDPKTMIGLYVVLGLVWTFYNATSGFFRRVCENARKNNMTGWLIAGVVLGVLLWPVGLGFCWLMELRAWRDAGKGGNDGSTS